MKKIGARIDEKKWNVIKRMTGEKTDHDAIIQIINYFYTMESSRKLKKSIKTKAVNDETQNKI